MDRSLERGRWLDGLLARPFRGHGLSTVFQHLWRRRCASRMLSGSEEWIAAARPAVPGTSRGQPATGRKPRLRHPADGRLEEAEGERLKSGSSGGGLAKPGNTARQPHRRRGCTDWARRSLERRLAAIRAYRHRKIIAPVMAPLLHVELTNACNLRCPICPRNRMTRPVGFMPLALAEKIAAEATGQSEFVTLHAWGESVLHPDLATIAGLFRSHGLRTQLSTNATLLTAERREQLLAAGIDFLVFSIDATSASTYNILRAGGDFAATVDHVTAFLAEARWRRLHTFCVAQLVYTTVNRPEAAAFAERWRALGAHVWLKPYNTWNGRDQRFRQYAPQADSELAGCVCDWPWRQCVIHWNGNVVPCCNDYDGECVLGNVTTQTLEEVWNGAPMQAFRAAHVRGRGSIEFCKACQWRALNAAGQLAFVCCDYLRCLKLQTRFENGLQRIRVARTRGSRRRSGTG